VHTKLFTAYYSLLKFQMKFKILKMQVMKNTDESDGPHLGNLLMYV
jgi:hypothetical protein